MRETKNNAALWMLNMRGSQTLEPCGLRSKQGSNQLEEECDT